MVPESDNSLLVPANMLSISHARFGLLAKRAGHCVGLSSLCVQVPHKQANVFCVLHAPCSQHHGIGTS